MACAGPGLGSGCFCGDSGLLLHPLVLPREAEAGPAVPAEPCSADAGADESIVAELGAVGGQWFHPRRAGEMLQALTECCSNEIIINNNRFHLFSGEKQMCLI